MKIVNKYTTLLLSLCAAFTACSDNEVLPENTPTTGGETGEKTPIELSVGGVDTPSATTRAVITDGTGKTMDLFKENANIFMVMMSEYGTEDFNIPSDQRTSRYTIARGDVNKNDKTTIGVLDVNKVTFDTKNQRYWDDAHARSSQLTIWAYAQIGKENWKTCTFQKQQTGTGWDAFTDEEVNTDEEGRGWTSEDTYYPGIKHWRASIYADNSQNATTVMCQDLLFSNNLANYDTDSEHPDATKDHRLKFDFTDRKFPTGEKTLMKFYHAMSKITIQIKAGDGFTATATSGDFAFTPTAADCNNIKLTGFNNDGVFNIKTGQFEHVWPTSETDPAPKQIPQIYLKTPNKKPSPEIYYTLEALVIPNIHEFRKNLTPTPLKDDYSRFVYGKKDLATDIMMEFAIDNNKYQITSGQLFDALCTFNAEGVRTGVVTNATEKTDNGTYIPLEAGKNYVFTFTVGKTKVKNITAQVASWENVEAENITPSNARIKLQLEERGTSPYGTAVLSTEQYSLYRSTAIYPANTEINDNFAAYDNDWETRYSGNVTTPSFVDGTATVPAHWTTSWFWESNKHFYHFRALMPSTTGITEDATNGDYATLTSAVSYTDVRWGAPMLDDVQDDVPSSTMKWNYGPTLYGFDGLDTKAENSHQIYKAIGPTEDAVKLIMFHIMSDLTFNITTTTGAEAVNLGDGSTSKTKVELVNFITNGKLLLGNGLVTATGDPTNVEIAQNLFSSAVAEPASAAKVKYTYGAVPQDLETVKLRITTPDNNQYIVDLKDVKAKNVSSINLQNPYTATGNKINRWYPGFKYVYSFTLKKTGITDLEATILEWEKVEADNEDVQIK